MAKKRVSAARLIGMLLALSPAIIASVLLWMATPDLESWLKARYGEFSRPDAFAAVNHEVRKLIVVLWIASLAGALLALAGRLRSATGLLAGPLLGVTGWLMVEDFKAPEWANLFALNWVFISAVTPVIFVWAIIPPLRRGVRGPKDAVQVGK